MHYDIIVIGSATRDVFLTAKDFVVVRNDEFTTGRGLCVPFGSKVAVEKILFASGGGGTNAAVTFARQGLKTAGIGVIGDDVNGTAVLDELRREGVDAKYFQKHDDDQTAYSVILVSEKGERTILSYKGEGMHFDSRHIPWDRLSAKWLYLNSLGGHIEILEDAVQWAQKTGAHIATNPGMKELEFGFDRLAPLWKRCAIVGMNQEEVAKVTGIPYEDEDALFKKMDDILDGVFILTKGSRGVAVSDGRFRYDAPVPSSPVIERTGAGDAFHSAFTAEFIRSGNTEKAVQLGTANASSVVMHYGAKAGILKKGERGPAPLVTVTKRAL